MNLRQLVWRKTLKEMLKLFWEKNLVLILIFVVYSRTKRPTPKHYMMGVDPNDEVRETIINYVEEGCPDVDQV